MRHIKKRGKNKNYKRGSLLCFSLIQGVPGLKKVEDSCFRVQTCCSKHILGRVQQEQACVLCALVVDATHEWATPDTSTSTILRTEVTNVFGTEGKLHPPLDEDFIQFRAYGFWQVCDRGIIRARGLSRELSRNTDSLWANVEWMTWTKNNGYAVHVFP